MPITTSTRKSVTDLSTADLEAFPVWEFAVDEEGAADQDETWVRPVAVAQIPRGGSSLCVATVFKLADGQVYPGVVFCDTDAAFEVAAVAILTTKGRVLFAASDSLGEVEQALDRLGLRAAQVFPMQYCTRIPLAGEGAACRGLFARPGV